MESSFIIVDDGDKPNEKASSTAPTTQITNQISSPISKNNNVSSPSSSMVFCEPSVAIGDNDLDLNHKETSCKNTKQEKTDVAFIASDIPEKSSSDTNLKITVSTPTQFQKSIDCTVPAETGSHNCTSQKENTTPPSVFSRKKENVTPISGSSSSDDHSDKNNNTGSHHLESSVVQVRDHDKINHDSTNKKLEKKELSFENENENKNKNNGTVLVTSMVEPPAGPDRPFRSGHSRYSSGSITVSPDDHKNNHNNHNNNKENDSKVRSRYSVDGGCPLWWCSSSEWCLPPGCPDCCPSQCRGASLPPSHTPHSSPNPVYRSNNEMQEINLFTVDLKDQRQHNHPFHKEMKKIKENLIAPITWICCSNHPCDSLSLCHSFADWPLSRLQSSEQSTCCVQMLCPFRFLLCGSIGGLLGGISDIIHESGYCCYTLCSSTTNNNNNNNNNNDKGPNAQNHQLDNYTNWCSFYVKRRFVHEPSLSNRSCCWLLINNQEQKLSELNRKSDAHLGPMNSALQTPPPVLLRMNDNKSERFVDSPLGHINNDMSKQQQQTEPFHAYSILNIREFCHTISCVGFSIDHMGYLVNRLAKKPLASPAPYITQTMKR
jgi:hypothetical protein